MTILFIVLGVLMILCGCSCIFTPLTTLINTEYFVVILVMLFGILGIVKSIAEKRFGVGFAFSILSIIFGIVILCLPELLVLTSGVLIYLVAAWFVLQSFVTIYTSFAVTKHAGGKMWILQLIFGILGLLLGCYTFIHPMIIAFSLGILVGIFFIETGITLILGSTVVDD